MLTMQDRYGVEIDNENWPKGMEQEEKDALVTAVRRALLEGPRTGLPLWVIDDHPEVRKVLRGAVVRGWRYAAVHRALLAVRNAEEHWVLIG